jgi:hypothetical protein
MSWLQVVSDNTAFDYNVLNLADSVGPYFAHNYVPTNSSIDGQIWVVLLPLLVSPGRLLVAEAFLAGYRDVNGTRSIAKAKRVRCLLPFQQFLGLGMTKVVRDALEKCSSASRSGAKAKSSRKFRT